MSTSASKCLEEHESPMKSSSYHRNHRIPVTILDELAVRFVINLPEWERTNLVRVCFQLELAHWFYIDFIRPDHPELADGTIHEFCAHMFNHVPFLRKFSSQVDTIVEQWSSYKMSVPVNGAIILNEAKDKVLMVRGFGSRAGWTFPKGKINQDEEDPSCAVREVLEETGYDVSHLIQKDLYLEKVIRFRTIRLFLISGAEEDFNFRPRVRGEIEEIKWWNIDSLPTSHSERGAWKRLGLDVHQFFTAIPFIKDIKLWAGLSTGDDRPEADSEDSKAQEECEGFIPESWSHFRLDLSDVESCYEECSSSPENDFLDQSDPIHISPVPARSPGY